MIVPLNDGIFITITIGRTETLGSITRGELNRLNEIHPIINSLVRQFWLSQSQDYVQYEKSDGPMNQAISTFGDGIRGLKVYGSKVVVPDALVIGKWT
mgnify:CR=1 FL=1